jgi:5'(3')-deoxyribonucleotidase
VTYTPKIKRYVDDPSLSFEERYQQLLEHHEQESKLLVAEIERLTAARPADKEAEPIALVDMDGTLCDFDTPMQRELEKLRGEDEYSFDYEDIPCVKARRDLIKRQPGFWRNLPRHKAGFEILDVLQELAFRPCVLTRGPSSVPAAWMEKVQWCRERLPGVPIFMVEDKGLVYGKVLVDDWPPYFKRWMEWRPRGLVVIPAQPWNDKVEFHGEGPNWIRYDGTNLDRVRERLAIVRATAGD